MAKRRRTQRFSSRDSGVSLNAAGDTATQDLYRNYEATEVPGLSPTSTTLSVGSQSTAFTRARYFSKMNYWLRDYMKHAVNVHNYGLRISAWHEDPENTSANESVDQKLKDWLTEESAVPAATVSEADKKTIGVASGALVSNKERLSRFIRQCWREYLLLDNLIVGWINGAPGAYILSPEKCEYKDVLGVETLFFNHGLGLQERKLLDETQQKIFAEAKVMFDPSAGTFFRVLKNEGAGEGLAWPTVQSIFRALGQMESMEIGESAYGFAGRWKFAHWKCGHEIKQGPMAGKPTHFWKKKEGDNLRKTFDKKKGYLGLYTGNFDQVLEYPTEPLDYYDEKKWTSVEHRLLRWGGPLARMLETEGLQPFLTSLLRTDVCDLRDQVGAFLESVINQSFGLPPNVKIQLRWSNRHFFDSKTMADLLKFGVTSGPVSQETFREEAGFDPVDEPLRKDAEGKESKSNPGKFKPAFDAAHGDQLDKGGKPPGEQDSDNQKAG